MNKKAIITAFIATCLVAVYNVIVFLCFREHNTNFWVSYGFCMGFIALTIGAYVFYKFGRKADSVDVSAPALSALALAIDLVMGIIFMCIPGLHFNVVFIPQIILFVLLIICYVPAMISVCSTQPNVRTGAKKKYHYQQKLEEEQQEAEAPEQEMSE